ncbi:MAG: choice-of-anchor J domain-containing protein [Lentimicrobiaceae bacterium]|nr:choice-of-anchor J domain-containing protein [Lentimicrobiaceae bacterium]
MKTYNIIKSSLLALGCGLMLSSCVKFQHDDVPPFDPNFEPSNAKIMSLDELYGHYPGDFDSVGQFLELNGTDSLWRDIYLNVVVIGNDVSGNIYKSMYVRDKNSERALNLSVDKTGLYNFYPVGQELYINCSGLYIGKYENLPQLGFRYADENGSVSLGRIPDAVFNRHVFKKGLAPADPAELPQPIEITDASQLENPMLYNQLVVLRNVQFAGDEVGQEFAPAPPAGTNPTSTNRYFSINGQGSFVLRTSSACRFFKRPIPAGIGDMVCIYAIYGDTKQFYLRSYSDLDTAKFNETGEVNYPIFSASFSSDLSYFKVVSVTGNARWTWGKYGDGCAMLQGSGTSKEVNEDWLISDPIDIPERFNDIKFSFEEALSYKYNSTYDWYAVRISTDYDPARHFDPNQATWQTLDMPVRHQGNNFTFQSSGEYNLASYKGQTFRIAFVYKSDTETMATWEVNKVKVIGNK